jgi:hypothetical protein
MFNHPVPVQSAKNMKTKKIEQLLRLTTVAIIPQITRA